MELCNAFEMRVYVLRGRVCRVAYSDFDWEACGYLGKPYDFDQKGRGAAVAASARLTARV